MITQLRNRRPLACTRGGHLVEGYGARRQVLLDIAYRQVIAAQGQVANADRRSLPIALARLAVARGELYELRPELRPRTPPTARRVRSAGASPASARRAAPSRVASPLPRSVARTVTVARSPVGNKYDRLARALGELRRDPELAGAFDEMIGDLGVAPTTRRIQARQSPAIGIKRLRDVTQTIATQ